MVVIGEDRSERPDAIPAQVRVMVTRRPKLACRACSGVVVQTPAPPRLIAGGLPTEALVAHVLVSRYADHLPLYRQAQMLARQGVELDRATLAFCWSHVRRGFYDLARTAAAPIATEALARIAALYRIEADIRGQAAEARRDARQARSRPLVTELHAWFTAQMGKLPARSPTAEAIRYALNHWDGLSQFLDDGRIEIDNNSVERAMRPIALSRKNALFAGSDEGGENWAAVASLIETCKLNAVDPQRYLTGLLTRLVNGWPQARIDALMPWNGAADTDGWTSSP